MADRNVIIKKRAIKNCNKLNVIVTCKSFVISIVHFFSKYFDIKPNISYRGTIKKRCNYFKINLNTQHFDNSYAKYVFCAIKSDSELWL